MDLEKAKIIVKGLLKQDRTEKYQPWIELGWCLHNIDDRLLEDWDKFSQYSKKYKPGECDSLWDHMEDRGLSMGSLIKWAKDDCLIDDDGLHVMDYLKKLLKKTLTTHTLS